MAKQTDTEQKQLNFIGVGTNITGDIECNGDIKIDGSLVGNMKVQGKVVIGATGKINGEITCKNALIEGKIDGKINVAELLALKTTAQILGDIKTGKLAIDPGANFTGNCTMGGGIQSNASFGSLPKTDEKKK